MTKCNIETKLSLKMVDSVGGLNIVKNVMRKLKTVAMSKLTSA